MPERYVIKMPQLSDTMTEGVLVSWEKNIGDKIERGDIVATVETDKAIMDVEVFHEGYLSGPQVSFDATVPVGDALAYLVATPDEVSAEAAQAVPAAGKEKTVPAVAETTASTDASADVPASSGTASAPQGVVHTIKMPQLSDTMTEGILVSWEKNIGDKIERGDIVATVETDKAIMDVEVFRDGILSGPVVSIDSTVPVGAAMAYLVASAEQVVDETASIPSGGSSQADQPIAEGTTGAATERVAPTQASSLAPAPRPAGKQATPYARQLAAEYGVDLAALTGSGPDGAITGSDVQQAFQQGAATASVSSGVPTMPEVQVPGDGRKMTSLERAISQNISGSLTMPTFRVTVNAHPDALIRAAKKNGVSVTVAIAKACALAMQEHPSMNWTYQPVDKLVERSNVDVGMAVAADDGGLVVPVLRDCESRSLEELNTSWKELVGKARNRRLKPEEFSDPTFMVSNMGMLGVSYFDAIPTPGIAAILAISAAGKEGMPLTITADHRVVNGAQVAQYLKTLKQTIEHPEAWMGTPGPTIPEGDWDYDVVMIGGGPGGEDCARDLVGHGLKVAMINDAPFPGGECLWRGCIPSKAWRAAADRIRDRTHDEHLGVVGTTEAQLDWSLLEKTRRRVLETRGEMALKTDQGVKIKVIQGYASFESDHKLFIDTSANSTDPHARPSSGNRSKGESLSFGCAVIATGAPPYVPPIPGAEAGVQEGGVLTSDTVWGLSKVPGRMVVIGGGAIGLEMAQIFQDFGSEVTLLEAQARILAEVESEIATQLTGILSDEPRLKVMTSVKIGAIEGAPGTMTVNYEDDAGKAHTADCDYVVMATGKRPVLEPLNLNNAGIASEKGIIKIDANCRTNVPHIFAVGDVIGGLMLAHTAGQQGRVAAATIAGEIAKYDQDKDCGVIFTRPQAAFVGLSVAQAKANGVDAVEVKMPFSIDAKAMITNETLGMIKIVADKATRRIIGVHFLADHADTLIGEAVMMVAGNMTLDQVAAAIHPHPTQTEMFGEMARRLLSRLRRSAKKAGKR